MDTREQFLVERLVERLATQPPQQIDTDAQREVELLLRRRPDAPYLLLQRALQLEEALRLAYEEIEQMRRRGPQAVPDATGFGRSGAGADASGRRASPADNAAASTAAGPAAMAAASLGGAAPATPGGDRAGAGSGSFGGPRGPGLGSGPMGGGLMGGAPGAAAQPGAMQSAGGGFLRNAGAVAAGVVGGSLLFHGIENLLHPHGSGLLGGNAPAGASGTANSLSDAPSGDASADAGAGFEPLPDLSQNGGYAGSDPADAPVADDYAATDGQFAPDDAGQWDDAGGSDDWA